jgi:hypothetical protein
MSIMREEESLRRFHQAILSMQNVPEDDPRWDQILRVVGGAWRRYELADDDATALEAMVRNFRFKR